MRSEWTTWRPPYPSYTGSLSSPSTIGSRPDPARRVVKTHDSEWGPRARKAGHQTRGGCSRNGTPPARKVPRSGSTSQPMGRFNPSDSDRLPPEQPGSQSDAAAARHYGAGGGRREYRECVGNPRACSRTRTTRRGNHLSRDYSDSTPKAYQLGLETTTPPVGFFLSTPRGTTQCMEQRLGRVQDSGGAYSTPRLLLPGDGPAREVPSWIRH